MPELRCRSCLRTYPLDHPTTVCSVCGSTLSVEYDYSSLKVSRKALDSRGFNQWRYLEVLPVEPGWRIVSLGEGGTFLHRCSKLNEVLGLRELLIKDETTNPTGSFLDRGASVALTRALRLKLNRVVCVSTGNLGASLSAYSAKAGVECLIYVPLRVDLGKLYQMMAYGADVRFTESLEEAQSKAARQQGYLVSAQDPFFLEGLKTTIWEVCNQLGWQAPDVVVMPMGSGGHVYMTWRGLKEMVELGVLSEVNTRIVGVQPRGCAPIVKAFEEGLSHVEPVEEVDTRLVDIGLKDPPHGDAALEAIRSSGGYAVAVSDEEALEAMKRLARLEGIFSEPAASSTIAGLAKLLDEGRIDRSERVVCVITGEGLKDPKTAASLASSRAEKLLISVKPQAKLGRTKLLILKTLLARPLHGYGLLLRLKKAGLELKPPSLYQHLSELEEMGLIRDIGVEVVRGRRRKIYEVTERGRRVLEGVS
ncbi:MAG: threonine synthase [Thermoprotei archaeon]|nr:MAG: threonine synthase [Thermoprotei archaeon]